MDAVRRRSCKSAWEFGIAAAFAVACIVLAIGVHESEASQPHVSVSGALAEWQVIGRRSSPALRLRMKEETIDFRVDPSLFRKAMRKAVPDEFVRGARVSVLVLEHEYAHPSTPQLGGNVKIAWVRGLTVRDRELFGLPMARAWEQENRRWSYLLVVISMGYAVYAGFKWRRIRGKGAT